MSMPRLAWNCEQRALFLLGRAKAGGAQDRVPRGCHGWVYVEEAELGGDENQRLRFCSEALDQLYVKIARL
jgi:hypothetical protein